MLNNLSSREEKIQAEYRWYSIEIKTKTMVRYRYNEHSVEESFRRFKYAFYDLVNISGNYLRSSRIVPLISRLFFHQARFDHVVHVCLLIKLIQFLKRQTEKNLYGIHRPPFYINRLKFFERSSQSLSDSSTSSSFQPTQNLSLSY